MAAGDETEGLERDFGGGAEGLFEGMAGDGWRGHVDASGASVQELDENLVDGHLWTAE